MENRYILATDTYDNKVFSICVFDREINSFIISESIVGEKGFKKKEKELLECYNAVKADDIETLKEKSNKLTGIPHISRSLLNYIKSDKFVICENLKDKELIEEMLSYGNVDTD